MKNPWKSYVVHSKSIFEIITYSKPGAGCSKHRQFNKHVKRSTCYVFYRFITKYTDIFVEKIREAFAKASHNFSTKNIGVFQLLMFEI